MALLQSLEKQGKVLFKYRGQFPILLFVLAIPFTYLTDYSSYSTKAQNTFILIGIVLSIIGFLYFKIAGKKAGTVFDQLI